MHFLPRRVDANRKLPHLLGGCPAKKLELEIWWVTGITFIISERIARFFHILEEEKQELCFRKCQHEETTMYSTQRFLQAFLKHPLGQEGQCC